MADEPRTRSLGAVLFPGFELLDLFGPLEMFGNLGKLVEVTAVAETAGPVRSAQGTSTVAEVAFAAAHQFDLLLIPGGWATREEHKNPAMLEFVKREADGAELLMTVCTGTMIPAAAGLLDGHKATTNKMAFAEVAAAGPKVEWVKQARWVEDGKFVTASGVSAGIDMALAVVQRLWGQELAERLATATEYDWHRDPSWDPFATVHGLA
ncbi:MAG: DJ-1/PfpI family protein [Dehalococcoidia bacterium]